MINYSLGKVIAIVVGFCFFFFIFGQTFFPKLFIFDLFVSQVDQTSQAVQNNPTLTNTTMEKDNDNENLYLSGEKEAVTAPGLERLVEFAEVTIGEGTVVEENSTIRLSYTGFLRDSGSGEETIFDQNLSETVEFNLGAGMLIPGFEAGLVGVREGGTRLITIQPEAGYGAQAVGDIIPANSVLHFLVEVHEVK